MEEQPLLQGGQREDVFEAGIGRFQAVHLGLAQGRQREVRRGMAAGAGSFDEASHRLQGPLPGRGQVGHLGLGEVRRGPSPIDAEARAIRSVEGQGVDLQEVEQGHEGVGTPSRAASSPTGCQSASPLAAKRPR